MDRRSRSVGRCRTCAAPVVWTNSAKTGKPMILDAAPKRLEPSDDGPDLGIIAATGETVRGMFLEGEPEEGDLVVHVSHFATCPDANQHRRSRKR